MGKGDKKTKKGKRWRGSSGKTRPSVRIQRKAAAKKVGAKKAAPAAKKAAAKKAAPAAKKAAAKKAAPKKK